MLRVFNTLQGSRGLYLSLSYNWDLELAQHSDTGHWCHVAHCYGSSSLLRGQFLLSLDFQQSYRKRRYWPENIKLLISWMVLFLILYLVYTSVFCEFSERQSVYLILALFSEKSDHMEFLEPTPWNSHQNLQKPEEQALCVAFCDHSWSVCASASLELGPKE